MIYFIWNVLQVEKQQSQKLCDCHLPVAYHLLPFWMRKTWMNFVHLH